MRRALCLAVLFGAAGRLSAEVRVGQKAPALRLGAVISGPARGPAAGDAIVIEFWATWCGPCRTAIPHLNALADRFRDRGIEFVSLTAEPEETVRKFLRAHPIRGTVALDPNYVNANAFGPLIGIPDAVLIDNSGVMAAIIRPAELNENVLEDLLAHRPLRLQNPDARILVRPTLRSGEKMTDADAVARAVLRRVSHSGSSVAGTDRYDSTGSGLKDLLAFAYGIPPFRIELPAYLAGDYYSVQAWVPPLHAETLKPMLQASIAAGASISVRRVERLADVLVLTGLPGRLRASSAVLSEGGFRRGSISGDLTIEELREYLETAAQKTVVTEHAPAGRFQVKLDWNPGRAGDLESAVRTELGLELKPGRRTVPFLLVDSLDAVK